MENERRNSSKGITLVSLVVTVIVLAILSSIMIAAVFGEGGLLSQSKDIEKQAEGKADKEESELNEILGKYDNLEGTEIPPSNKDLSDLTEIQDTTVITKDSKGNKVIVPGGFKVRTDLGDTVQKGIVIEDREGNQFVWIPLGVVHKDDGTDTEPIELGRYTFNTSNGTPTLAQSADDYTQTVTLLSYYQELSTFREANSKYDLTGLNATAKNLKGFVENAKINGGYYIARFEASYGSGSSVTDYKPLSQKSIANSTNNMSYTKGMLWNWNMQGDASKISRNMYAGNSFVESDLINSYAWDTAIVYIESCSNNPNYANANRDTVSQAGIKNTGETGDEVCHINDMASNLFEWSTEFSPDKTGTYTRPCTYRGGSYFNNTSYASHRLTYYATYNSYFIGFRPILSVYPIS